MKAEDFLDSDQKQAPIGLMLVMPLLGIGPMLCTWRLISIGINSRPLPWDGFLLGGLLFAAGLSILTAGFKRKVVFYYKDRLEIRSFFGKRLKEIIYYRDTSAWYEESESSFRYFYANDKYYYINPKDLNDFQAVMAAVQNELQPETEQARTQKIEVSQKKNKRATSLILFISSGVAFFLSGFAIWCCYTNRDKAVSTNELATVQGVLPHSLKVFPRGKSRHYIPVMLNKYPGLTFYVDDLAYSYMYRDSLLKLHSGDTLAISILKTDSLMYIAHQLPLNYWDKVFNSDPHISVFQVWNHEATFLTKEDYNTEVKSSVNNFFYLILGFPVFILLGLFFMYKSIQHFLKFRRYAQALAEV
jgi:hypothetical protein